MTVPESGKTWRKSSYSSQGGDCVEIQRNLNAVRDSKNPASMLTVDVCGFVAALRAGRFDRR